MAYKKLKSGKYEKITAEHGAKLWLIMNREVSQALPSDIREVREVDRIILNSKNPSTPLSYLVIHTSPVDVDYKAVMGATNV